MAYPGYPPSDGSYPPGQMNNQPQVGFTVPGGGYPQPANTGGYPGGYPAPQSSYPQPQGNYPPPAGYPPPGNPGYPPPGNAGYPPTGNAGYPPPGVAGYPAPAGAAYPQPGAYGQHPITTQPGPAQGENWMQAPGGPPNCPPGLEYLTMVDQLLVHQKIEVLEALTGFETKNKFTVKNSMGQKVYNAVESSNCLTRNCCGPIRPFDMKIMDNFKNQVIHLNRPLACQSCCFPCCLQTMEVTSPPGTVVGSVEQEWSILAPKFKVLDAGGNVVLRIKGPILTYSICGDVEFKVLTADGERQVGKISKQWSGLLREAFTDTDYFGITFPMDLDVKMKAVMLGACFLIDAMFFEKKGNREQDGIGMF